MAIGSSIRNQIEAVPQVGTGLPSADAQLEIWHGASGKPFLHLAYSLIQCPAMPKANYLLVRRGADGVRSVLKVGRVSHDAPSLNLAQIRQEGAILGAQEVHLHVLARSDAERILVEFDVAAANRADNPADEAAVVHH